MMVTTLVTVPQNLEVFMSKARRLNEMIMMVNRKKRFTVRELAQEFGVSKRTILRDLQELSAMGVPLYSETGPNGGYRVLKERVLPPIAFTGEEVMTVFFAIHALRHYLSLPFDVEYESVIKKFYLNLSGDLRDTIDNLKDRMDFVTVHQQEEIPFLKPLLKAAVQQEVLNIRYQTGEKTSCRKIQPIGVYARDGKWYCPAYCFLRKDYRVFRCDRIQSVEHDENTKPVDLSGIRLKNRFSLMNRKREMMEMVVELTQDGTEKFQPVQWPDLSLEKREDGSGLITGRIAKDDLPFFADYFLKYGEHALVKKPLALKKLLKERLAKTLEQYRPL